MSVMPRKKYEKIQWCEGRIAGWTTNATAIGTTTAAMTALAAEIAAARAAATAAETARAAAEAATGALDEAVAKMDLSTQNLIKQVRVKADATGDPAVYQLAQIPAPATPEPVGDPGKPVDFTAVLSESGTLDINWKCKNPPRCTGVMYQVWRRIGGVGEFSYVGGSGQKQFTDATIPAGTTHLTYQVQGVRSTGAGPWSQFNVSFGPSVSGGAVGISVTATPVTPGPRMAA